MKEFTSFYRQLNIYSLRKRIGTAPNTMVFCNEFLRKGRGDLLLKMKRNDIERNRNRPKKYARDFYHSHSDYYK